MDDLCFGSFVRKLFLFTVEHSFMACIWVQKVLDIKIYGMQEMILRIFDYRIIELEINCWAIPINNKQTLN